MMIAWYFHDRPLPPSLKEIAVTLMLVALPRAVYSCNRI